MSIEAKKMFSNSMHEKLKTILTVSQMNDVLSTLSDELNMYNLEATEQNITRNYDLLEAYVSSKRVEGRSENTLVRYEYVLNKIMAQIGIPESQVTVFHLRKFLCEEKNRGISDSTLEGYRSILCSYFGWLHRECLIPNNPCDNLGVIKCPKVVRLPFTDVDIERLKQSCWNIRDKALICFLLSTGCRIGEVIKLNRDDVDYQGMQCKVIGKGNKERIVYIDNITRMHLKKYMSSRNDSSEALFSGRGSDRLTAGGVRKMLKSVEQISGVENVHPHRFRRTLATNLINRGMPIQEVAKILGHDRLDTTMKYIYIDDASIKAAYKKYA